MPGFTTSQLSNLLNEVTPQLGLDLVERKTWFMDFFKRRTQLDGDAIDWKINYAGNTGVESFVQGQAEKAAGYQAWLPATLAWAAHRVIVRIERMAIEDSRGVSLIGDILQGELAGAEKDLVEDMADAIFGTSAVPEITGIGSAVDSAGTYAGIDKGVYTWWASYEAAVGGGALSDIDTALDTLYGPTYKGKPTHILANETESRVIANLAAADDRSILTQADVLGGSNYKQGGYTGLMYDGRVKLERVPGLTADTVYYINQDEWELVTHRDMLLDEWERDGDALTTVLSWRGNLACYNARGQGKDTGF